MSSEAAKSNRHYTCGDLILWDDGGSMKKSPDIIHDEGRSLTGTPFFSSSTTVITATPGLTPVSSYSSLSPFSTQPIWYHMRI